MEMSTAPVLIRIDDPSGVAEARRRAERLAEKLGFDETASGRLAIAVTEVGSNIVKHAGRGSIALRCLEAGGIHGVEVVAMDSGPGVADVARSLRDGHSTAGSPGTGLGAIQRLTSAFTLYTGGGRGVVARFECWPGSRRPPAAALEHGALSFPKPGETECGDEWTLISRADRHILVVVDGLGHGPDAAEAARVAIRTAVRARDVAAPELIGALHDALRPTRGAAGAVAILDPAKQLCTWCGIGNISASIRLDGASRSMVSHNGILGHQMRKIQDFAYPFPAGALCIAHSDGVSARWDLAAYPGLERSHPGLVAGVLFRDHCRPRDDATVVAVRAPGRAA